MKKRGLAVLLTAALAVSMFAGCGSGSASGGGKAVSYTHLDVYKRQAWNWCRIPFTAAGAQKENVTSIMLTCGKNSRYFPEDIRAIIRKLSLIHI